MERPSREEIGPGDRGEKIRRLRSSAERAREELVGWIESHGLGEEVTEVSEPTAFNVLFVSGEEEAVGKLLEAPKVVSVSPSDEFPVDLRLPGSPDEGDLER